MDDCIDLAVGNQHKKDIVEILEAYLEEHTADASAVTDIGAVREYEEMRMEQSTEHTRAYIKIQDGCNQFCSYCIIPFVRGRVRSRKQEDVLAEVRGLAEKGFQEVVITGIHLSSYGMDFIGETDGDYLKNGKDLRGTAFERAYLVSLLEEIAKVDGIRRIRLGSLEPRIITEEFAGRLAAIPQLCPHFHLSLQSGCDETLKRMNRHYTAEEYYEKVQILRKYFEHPAITTDVIVGFRTADGRAEDGTQRTAAGAGKGTVQRIPCALSGTGSGSPDRRAEGDRRKGILARSYGYLCKGCVCGGQCRMHGLFEPAGARTSGFFPVGRGFGNCIEFLREVG